MIESIDQSPEPGLHKLGRYTIRAELGRGGFATVYRAFDPNLHREIALKILHPQYSIDRNFVELFRKEAQALANLQHPHIVIVHDVGEADGRLFIVMHLAQGPSLAQAITERGAIPWAEAHELIQPVCEALEYAHSRNIVHRDLKPANILLDKNLGPLLSDFGLARLMDQNSIASTRSGGGAVGTPAYMAPEIWEGKKAGPATDIYALGCTLFEMLTGAQLFNGPTSPAIMLAHFQPRRYPPTWPEDVPTEIRSLLGNCRKINQPKFRVSP